MGLPRSTYYDATVREADDAEIVATMKEICDEFEAYGYRRVGAELRQRGIIVNSKKIRRLMREHDLQPTRRRRFVATTDSNHDGPIFPDLARDRMVDGPNQLWVADITYIAIATGFVYMAAILDAWSRRVVGYAISRSIDARLAVAALKGAIRARQPPKGCIHHSDRGSQYASEAYRSLLAYHGLLGSMGRGEPLRQCEGSELYEDAQGRGRLSEIGSAGVRRATLAGGRADRRGMVPGWQMRRVDLPDMTAGVAAHLQHAAVLGDVAMVQEPSTAAIPVG
jgi:putative transposase